MDEITPPPTSPADPRPGEVAHEAARAARWLAGVDLDQLGDRDLLELVEALGPVADRIALTTALAMGRVEVRDATVAVDGLLPDAWLRQAVRRTGADRASLLCVGQVLPTLPRLHDAAVAGEVSWSEVRPICRAVARLCSDDRARVDRQLAGDRDALRQMAPGEVLELLDQLLPNFGRPTSNAGNEPSSPPSGSPSIPAWTAPARSTATWTA